MEPDIESMTLDEYREYEAEKERRLWDIVRSKNSQTRYKGAEFNSSHRDKSFFAQPPNTPNTPVDKKDSDFDEILDDLFILGAENLRRKGQEKDVDLEKEEARVEDDDDGDTYDIWDITVKDVERTMQIFNVHDETDEAIQPLIPQPIHTTPLNDDYVAPTTKSILDGLLEEFGDEIVNATIDYEEATKDSQSQFTEIQVHSVVTKLEPFIHTRPLSPLCRMFKTSKPCKVDMDIITPGRYYRMMHMEGCLANYWLQERTSNPD
ncbi:hypothetical protein Tco_1085952 [Tanacetum coccineum]